MAISTYNPKRNVVILGGIPITGFADGTFIRIQQQGDGMTHKVGAQGDIARSVSPNSLHQVTLTLLPGSASNAYLTGIHKADRLTCGGAMVPIGISDLCGLDNFVAAQAWIPKMPDMSQSVESENREWVLFTGAPSIYILGGQTEFSAS